MLSVLPISYSGFAQPRTHALKAAPDTVVWGYYDSSVPPVMTVDSGDIVDVETMITGMASILGENRVKLVPDIAVSGEGTTRLADVLIGRMLAGSLPDAAAPAAK